MASIPALGTLAKSPDAKAGVDYCQGIVAEAIINHLPSITRVCIDVNNQSIHLECARLIATYTSHSLKHLSACFI